MKSFIEQAQLHTTYHPYPRTHLTYFLGIPLIILSLMILLGFIKVVIPGVYQTNVAILVSIALMIYYCRLNWQLALPVVFIFILLLWVAGFFNQYGPTTLGIWAFVITFILGVGLHLYGYYSAGKKPIFAFKTDMHQVLLAPLFLMAELMFRLGFMHHLKSQMYVPVSTDELP